MLSSNGWAPIPPPLQSWFPTAPLTIQPKQKIYSPEDKSSTKQEITLCVWGRGVFVRLGASHIHRSLLRFSSPCLHPFWHLTWETLTWGFKHWALSITVDPRLWGMSAGWARLIFFFSILRAVYSSVCAWEGNNSSSGPLRPPPLLLCLYLHTLAA